MPANVRLWVPVLLLPAAIQCWQQRWDFQTAVWQDSTTVIEVHAGYEERDPFDPTAGTTLKRNFQTRLHKVSVADAAQSGPTSQIVQGQALEDVYFIQDSYYFIVIPASNPAERALVRVSQDLKSVSQIEFQERPPLSKFLPSPDRRKVALLFGEGESALIQVVPAGQINQPGTAVKSGPVAAWSWSSDSSGLFLFSGTSVLSFDGRALKQAGRFPRCFRPGTSWEGPIGDHGILYARDTLQSPPQMQEVPGWRAHNAVPFTTDTGQIGVQCK